MGTASLANKLKTTLQSDSESNGGSEFISISSEYPKIIATSAAQQLSTKPRPSVGACGLWEVLWASPASQLYIFLFSCCCLNTIFFCLDARVSFPTGLFILLNSWELSQRQPVLHCWFDPSDSMGSFLHIWIQCHLKKSLFSCVPLRKPYFVYHWCLQGMGSCGFPLAGAAGDKAQ